MAFVLGGCSKLTDGLHAANNSLYLLHFLAGLFTAVGTLLTHCLIFTYFLGTGRWVKEVTLAYDLPDAPWHKRNRELKRLVFPAALAAMLVTIATAAGGAGTDASLAMAGPLRAGDRGLGHQPLGVPVGVPNSDGKCRSSRSRVGASGPNPGGERVAAQRRGLAGGGGVNDGRLRVSDVAKASGRINARPINFPVIISTGSISPSPARIPP